MPDDAAVVARLMQGGVLTPDEAAALPPDFPARLRRNPYTLTARFSELPPPALRWGWEPERAVAFCQWVEETLERRFGVALRVTAGPDGAPALLRLTLGDREEVVDWAYLNSARWMGSFCTIAARLLTPHGVEAVELETGDFDTVVLFCTTARIKELEMILAIVP